MSPKPLAMDERRYYGLDALRGVMMLLGIVLHSAMFYIVMPSEVVPLKDPRTSPIFDLTILLIHSFRMPLFFLLSGFFAALLVEKYGMRRAYWNSVERVFLPFWIGLVTLLPVTGWMMFSFGVSAELGTKALWSPSNPGHAEWLSRFVSKLGGGGPGHLWFLYYLMMLYLLLPFCAYCRRVIERRGSTTPFGRLVSAPWSPVWLAMLTAMTLWPYKGGVVEGFQYFRPHVPSLIYYGLFFTVGYLVHGFTDFLNAGERHLRVYAAASVLLFVLSLGPTHFDYAQRGANPWLHLAAVIVNGLLTWALIFASIGLFQRYLDRDSPWVAYISQSSYWVYLVHLPIVSFAAWYLVDVDVPAVVKFSLAATFTAVVAFLSYHYLVRRTWISVLLNGRRFTLRWPWLEQEGIAYSTAMGSSASPVKN